MTSRFHCPHCGAVYGWLVGRKGEEEGERARQFARCRAGDRSCVLPEAERLWRELEKRNCYRWDPPAEELAEQYTVCTCGQVQQILARLRRLLLGLEIPEKR
jgi:hypothetical protein